MKYQIKLTNGTTVFGDTYDILHDGTLTYKNGTIEVLMRSDLYVRDSITRVRVKTKK